MLTLKEVYELGVRAGIKADPRGAKRVKEYLDRVKKYFKQLSPSERPYFNKEKLKNPYFDDGHVHFGDTKTRIKRVLAGVDIGQSELLLASQLSERGQKIDVIISHHTLGSSKATLTGVMDLNIDRYEDLGMPVHLAEKVVFERKEEVSKALQHLNHYRLVDIARLLGLPVMNMHTATDNLADQFLQDFLIRKKPETIRDVVDALMEIPEFQDGRAKGVGPVVVAGSLTNKVGKFVLEMTGGVNPGGSLYPELSRAGISTVIAMHIQEDARIKLVEQNMNAVVSGHVSSDSLGMNLYLDELEKKGIEVIPCGGLIRVSRVKNK